ncbi:RnfH family protein [Methylomonas sp. AM2-LC]|uniref:RnfH family protein n=1 Tax=Methylomonas sp. AM2-LC TaxID=3153301 RepID=UPI0032648D04
MVPETIAIEVVYATLQKQTVIPVQVPLNCTANDAIETSGILQLFPEINLQQHKIGIFSQICTLQKILSAGDRIEIYRPLIQNPMAARRERMHKS